MNTAKAVKGIVAKTLFVTLEVLNLLTRSPFQSRDNDNIGRMSLMQEILSRGLDQVVRLGLTPDGICIEQGHRRRAAINLLFELFPVKYAELFPNGIPVKVTDYESFRSEALRDATLDQGSTVGLSNVWELYNAFKHMRANEETVGACIYKLQSAFDHCFGRRPDREAKIRSFEYAAEAAAKAGDFEASEAALKDARTEMAKYRNGATQTFGAVMKLGKVAEDYMRRAWLGQLDTGEAMLSHGPLMKLAKVKDEQPQDFAAAWDITTKPEVKPKVVSLTKAQLKTVRDAASSKVLIVILDAIASGNLAQLSAVSADLTAEDVQCSFKTASKVK